ncbi:hypothetical protein JCM11641_001784 [Rhodosporidiobolus odoratus]
MTEQATAKRDYVSTLPAEILTEIFNTAYKDDEATGPLSRILLPFDRSRRFRQVEVESVDQLKSLMEVMDANSRLGEWVKELSVAAIEGVHSSRAGPRLPSDRQLKTFFSHLTNLTDLILSPDTATMTLPLDSKNPFDATPFRFLSSYPGLNTLKLTDSTSAGALSRLHLLKRSFPTLPSITSLAITSPGAHLPLVSPLVSACNNLRTLILETSHTAPEFSALLTSLSPIIKNNLKSLSLKTEAYFDDFSSPCDTALVSFPNLAHLYLGEGTFSPTILSTLRRLPHLISLGFGPGAIISTAELSTFVEGPTRSQQLQKLTLDVVFGKRGWMIMKDGHGLPHPNADPTWHTGPDWDLPLFDPPDGGFNEDNVAEFVKVAEANGVKVEGTTIEALGIMQDWYFELSESAIAYGYMTGDFGQARAIFGDEYIDGILMEGAPSETGSWDEGDFAFYEGDWGCG